MNDFSLGFFSWRSWSCGYLGCCHGIRYTCFSGREHFVGRPRPSPTFTKNHHGVLLFTQKKNQQGVLLTHFLWIYLRQFLYMAMQDQRVMYLGVRILYVLWAIDIEVEFVWHASLECICPEKQNQRHMTKEETNQAKRSSKAIWFGSNEWEYCLTRYKISDTEHIASPFV
jgi:hypothetical protein